MSAIVLDTSILIDLLRGHAPAIAYLNDLDAPPTCSEITRVEILRGMRSRERAATESLLRTIDWVPVDEIIARRAGHLGRSWRRSHGLSSADLVIAATVEELEGKLATGNVKHFPMFEELRSPY